MLVLDNFITQAQVMNSIESIKSQIKNHDNGIPIWDVSNGIAVIILMIMIFFVILQGISYIANYRKIRKNWNQYRCNPSIMPLASIYGYDPQENFQFCMGKIFETHSSDFTSSFTTMLRGLTGVMGTLLGSMNSMRLSIATMGGGLNVIFQEFTDRIRTFFFKVRVSAITIKQLMYRLYATFFAVIYMGLSAITGMNSLGNTVLFKFLDTFCFHPETKIQVRDRGLIPIQSVQIGDILERGGERVTATFQFFSDGQPMVYIPIYNNNDEYIDNIHVSTNHYIRSYGKWVKAIDYPDAIPVGPWKGGAATPLICLNTDKHTITFSDTIVFADYDETTDGDMETMTHLQRQVNGNFASDLPAPISVVAEGGSQAPKNFTEYSPVLSPTTEIILKTGEAVPVRSVRLGDYLSTNSQVVGIIQKEITEYCVLDGVEITPSTLVWQNSVWERAGNFLPVHTYSADSPRILTGLFASHNCQIELANGHIIRDYLEVFSPDSEQAYSKALEKISARL